MGGLKMKLVFSFPNYINKEWVIEMLNQNNLKELKMNSAVGFQED